MVLEIEYQILIFYLKAFLPYKIFQQILFLQEQISRTNMRTTANNKVLSPQPKKTVASNQKANETAKYSSNNPQTTLQYYRSPIKYSPQPNVNINTPTRTQEKSRNPTQEIVALEQQIHFMSVKHDNELTKIKRENAANLRKIEEGYRKKIILLEEQNDVKQDDHYNRKINQLKDQKARAERATESLEAELKKINQNIDKTKEQNQVSLKSLKEQHKRQILEANKIYQAKIRSLQEEQKVELRKNISIHETQVLNMKIANREEISSLLNQINHLKFVQKTQMERLVQNQINQLNSMKRNYEKNVDQIKKDCLNEVAQVKAHCTKEVKQKQAWFNGEIEKIKEQVESSKINEILKLRQDFANQLTALKGKSLRDMQSGKSDHEKEIQILKNRHLKEMTQINQQIKWLKEKEIKDKATQIKELKAQIVALKEEAQRFVKQKDSQIGSLERKMRTMQAQAEAKIQEIRKQSEKQKQQVHRRHEQQIKTLHSREDVDRIKTEFNSHIAKINKSHADEIGRWNQKLNIKNTEYLESIISIKKKHEDQIMGLESTHKEEISKIKKLKTEEQNKLKNAHVFAMNQLKAQFNQAKDSYSQFAEYSKNQNIYQMQKLADEKYKQITKLRKQNHDEKSKVAQLQNSIQEYQAKVDSQKLEIDRLLEIERSYVESISKVHDLEQKIRNLQSSLHHKQGQMKDLEIQLINKDRSHDLQLKKVQDQVAYSENQKFMINMKDFDKLKHDQIARLTEKFNVQKQEINQKTNIEKKSLKDRITALESSLISKQNNFKRICHQNEQNMAQLMRKAEEKQKAKKEERLRRQFQLKCEQQEISKEYTTYIKNLERQNQNYQNQINVLKLTNKTLRDQLSSKLDSYTKDREAMDQVKILKQKLQSQQDSHKKFTRTHQRYGTAFNVRESPSAIMRQTSPRNQSGSKRIKTQTSHVYSSRESNANHMLSSYRDVNDSSKLKMYDSHGPSSKLSLHSRY